MVLTGKDKDDFLAWYYNHEPNRGYLDVLLKFAKKTELEKDELINKYLKSNTNVNTKPTK